MSLFCFFLLLTWHFSWFYVYFRFESALLIINRFLLLYFFCSKALSFFSSIVEQSFDDLLFRYLSLCSWRVYLKRHFVYLWGKRGTYRLYLPQRVDSFDDRLLSGKMNVLVVFNDLFGSVVHWKIFFKTHRYFEL